MDALTDAADSFGIGHRQIGVLKALFSFHPDRTWSVTSDALVVFPSNRTLSQRLGGMPESTLRRHLSRLVEAGLLARRASPNGKRYRRGRGATEIAFGLDLAPLLSLFGRIQESARKTQAAAEERAGLRVRLLDLRHRLRAQGRGDHHPILEDLDKALRRKLSTDDLRDLIDSTEDALSAVTATPDMSGNDAQNERHIEPQCKINSHPEITGQISLGQVDAFCKERATYFPEPLQDWQDLVRQALKIGPMLGLRPGATQNLFSRYEPVWASIAMLITLERFEQVDSPEAYAAWLMSHPEEMGAILNGLNPENCQLTTLKRI